MAPYKEMFPTGSRVRVASRAVLEAFLKNWKFHNPITPEQLAFAGKAAKVASVGFYHGGDPLYVLEGIPGVWHERCLVAKLTTRRRLSLLQRLAYAIELRRRAGREAKLNAIVTRAVQAVVDSIAGTVPAVSEHFFYGATGIDPRLLVTWYLFNTDAELKEAGATGLTERIIAETRSQLLDKGYPPLSVPLVHVAFTTDEDIRRKTGGNRYLYFK